MKAIDVELALTAAGAVFNPRRYLVVPNVSWGWRLHYEADLIAAAPSGICHEVEIKVSRADLRADALKAKWNRGLDRRISKFWYAVPEDLLADALESRLPGIEAIPGVIVVRKPKSETAFPRAEVARRPDVIGGARKASSEEITELYRLGYLRFWDAIRSSHRDRSARADDVPRGT